LRLLLVEDDEVIAGLIQAGMREVGFDIDRAPEGRSGFEVALRGTYSLIILDLLLPGRDGWSVCLELRARGVATPILMLTARSAVEDRVRGLETGADDYLPKPFAFPELVARVRALLRRDKQHRARVIRIEDLEIDTTAASVHRAGRPIHLTPREYSLLEALAANEGRVLTREAILERVWMDEESYSDTVRVHVMALRKKVDADHPVKLIHTVRGIGYSLRRPQEEG
jgi:two-component system, OmpR family, copper resistance phosphate regulon response regulator CusR